MESQVSLPDVCSVHCNLGRIFVATKMHHCYWHDYLQDRRCRCCHRYYCWRVCIHISLPLITKTCFSMTVAVGAIIWKPGFIVSAVVGRRTLTYLLTHLLTHSLTNSLTHSLTYSLTYLQLNFLHIRLSPEIANIVSPLSMFVPAPNSILSSSSLSLLTAFMFILVNLFSYFLNSCFFHSFYMTYPVPSSFDFYRELSSLYGVIDISTSHYWELTYIW